MYHANVKEDLGSGHMMLLSVVAGCMETLNMLLALTGTATAADIFQVSA
jgi:hypothetical protein